MADIIHVQDGIRLKKHERVTVYTPFGNVEIQVAEEAAQVTGQGHVRARPDHEHGMVYSYKRHWLVYLDEVDDRKIEEIP